MNIAITTQRLGKKAMVLVTALPQVRPSIPFFKKLLCF
jgi:hypothetical protein